LLVESLWLFNDVLLLREEEQITVLGDLSVLSQVLKSFKSLGSSYFQHLTVEDGGNCVDDAFDLWLVNGGVEEHCVHGGELFSPLLSLP